MPEPDYSGTAHKFRQASQFRNDYSALVCTVPTLQPIAQAFIRNMNRVRGMGALPINLLAIGMSNEAARIEALFNMNIKPGDPRIKSDGPQFDSDLSDQIDEERKRIMYEWIESYPNREDFSAAISSRGEYGLNVIVEQNKEESWPAIQATMAAMIIGLWTAFESLAQDTWIIAVN